MYIYRLWKFPLLTHRFVSPAHSPRPPFSCPVYNLLTIVRWNDYSDEVRQLSTTRYGGAWARGECVDIPSSTVMAVTASASSASAAVVSSSAAPVSASSS